MRATDDAGSDSGETENIAPGWQQCLHRRIIDTSFANHVARKFRAICAGFRRRSVVAVLEELEQALSRLRVSRRPAPGKSTARMKRLVSQRRKRAFL